MAIEEKDPDNPGLKITPELMALIASGRGNFICAGIVFLSAFALYAWTAAPTVTLVDSGELLTTARFAGVAHPPGFPLWVVLAHLASLIPIGNVAWRINLSSAFFGALASAVTMLVVAELLSASRYFKIPKARRGKRKIPSARNSGRRDLDNSGPASLPFVLLPATTAGLLLAFSRTLWAYATVAEVYTLNTFLILLIFFLMLRWRRGGEKRDSSLYLAAVVFGIALGVHHVTVALVLPAIALLVYRTEGLVFFKSRRFLYAAIISLAAMIAIYSYLPIAAAQEPLMNWGEPTSLKAIWWHISGRQYQTFLSFDPKILGEQLAVFGGMAAREFSPSWLPLGICLALVGFWSVFRTDRTAFWFLAWIIGADLAYASSYVIAEDKDAYYLTTFVVLVIAASAGLRELLYFIFSKLGLSRMASVIAAILLLVAPSLALASNLPFNNRRHYWIARDYVSNIFRSVEPRGLLLTFDWEVASPIFYAQQVERRRRDVKVVDINLLRRSWYFDYLKSVYPDLIERSRGQVDSFVAELKNWEQDETAYTGNEAAQRISSKFEEMIASFVKQEMQVATAYVTLDFLTPEERDRNITSSVMEHYGLVPQGLVFKLVRDRTAFRDPRRIRIETRGLTGGTLHFEKDDVVKTKVFPVYVMMLVNRGRYLASFGQHQRAAAAFKEALTLDPESQDARRSLQEVEGKLPAP
jgi:hypothetical protein